MRVAMGVSFRFWCLLAAVLVAAPGWTQSLGQALSHGQQQPSRQQIEGFCGNWGQLSNSEQKQYREQYERYCREEPVFGRPVAPRPQTNILQPAEPEQQQPRQQPQQQPQKPTAPEKPEEPEPAEPEPQVQPATPEPVIPEPQPLRVDLVGELALTGPLAGEPGERQRLRVTVENRGPDAPRGNRLWARVFLSERQVSGRGASSFSLPAVQRGRPLRLPGVPGPGRLREVTTEVTVPAGMPDGNYWWCVRLDTRQQVEETDEGNNTACARKVVALGGESESGLSNVFGSKVDELNEREDMLADPTPEGMPAAHALGPAPDDIQPIGDDDGGSLPPPAIRDLELKLVVPLASHDIVPYPDALLGYPYEVRIRVRNNGTTTESFHPYFMFEGDHTAQIGVFSGFGSLGGSEPGIEIGPGETKWARMFIDFRREALPDDYLERLELEDPDGPPRSVDAAITIFLGDVDAHGDTLDERVFKDADIGNHVLHPFTVTVISPGKASPVATLAPVKTGAELVDKHYGYEGVACGVNRSGLGDSRYWLDLEHPVGHRKSYTGNRGRCRTGGSESFVSLVKFDTEAMRPPDGWSIRSAVLRFEARDPGLDRRNGCDTTAVDNVAVRHAEWSAGKQEVERHGIISSSGIRAVTGTEVDISDWVRAWVNGDRDNFGIGFLGAGFADALSRGNAICVTDLGSFELRIVNEPA